MLAGQDWELIVSSAERKAVETAEIVSTELGLHVSVEQRLGENDRSATGFLPPAEFERTADDFFARPDDSIRGWETATAARDRIVGAVRQVCAAAGTRSVVFIAHGAVGALLLSDLLGTPITRRLDQPRQGCWFAFDAATWSADHTWRTLPEA